MSSRTRSAQLGWGPARRRGRPQSTVGTIDGVSEYEVIAYTRAGGQRVHRYGTDEVLEPGDVMRLEGRYWLVESVEPGNEVPRVQARPARYRLRLHHPDGHDELGAFRRYRSGAPRVGHGFTTIDAGQPVSWEVVEEALAYDDQTEPYLELVAERDFSEVDELQPHELPMIVFVDREGVLRMAHREFKARDEATYVRELRTLLDE